MTVMPSSCRTEDNDDPGHPAPAGRGPGRTPRPRPRPPARASGPGAAAPYRTAAQLAPLGAERTHAVVLSLVDTLVDLHAVDPEAVGLADFGRPEGFLERQLRRWGKQLSASKNRELAGIDELHETLG